jgi:hypothetical protein
MNRKPLYKTDKLIPMISLVMGRPGDGMTLFASEVIRRQVAVGGVTITIDGGQSHRTLARALQHRKLAEETGTT